MKPFRTSMLVLAGLVFASILWMQRPVKQSETPKTSGVPLQQFAVETLPVAPPAPIVSAPIDTPVVPEPVKAIENIPAPQETPERERLLSFIQFIQLSENYGIFSEQIAWNKYREYRRRFAFSASNFS